jgi:hypothetical protein
MGLIKGSLADFIEIDTLSRDGYREDVAVVACFTNFDRPFARNGSIGLKLKRSILISFAF